MPLTLASNAITFTDNTSLSSGIIGTAQLSAEAITNAQIATNAAISGTKINPNFGSQDVITTGKMAVGSSLIEYGTGFVPRIQCNYLSDGTIGVSRFSSNGNNSPGFIFYKSNVDTIGNQGQVTLDTNMGTLQWRGSDGTKGVASASIAAFVHNTVATDSIPSRIGFFTTSLGQTTPTEKLRITASGGLESPNGQAFYGAVSNSGNGAIMENGSTTNGEYIRYANGIQLCWRRIDSNAANNLTWTYPATFTVTPVIQVTPIRGNARSIALLHYDGGALPTNTSTLISRWISNTAAADTCWVMCFASGRWY